MKMFRRTLQVEGNDMSETPENAVLEESGYQDHVIPPAHAPAEDIEPKTEPSDLQAQIQALRDEAKVALAEGDQDKLRDINAKKRTLLAQL